MVECDKRKQKAQIQSDHEKSVTKHLLREILISAKLNIYIYYNLRRL